MWIASFHSLLGRWNLFYYIKVKYRPGYIDWEFYTGLWNHLFWNKNHFDYKSNKENILHFLTNYKRVPL